MTIREKTALQRIAESQRHAAPTQTQTDRLFRTGYRVTAGAVLVSLVLALYDPTLSLYATSASLLAGVVLGILDVKRRD